MDDNMPVLEFASTFVHYLTSGQTRFLIRLIRDDQGFMRSASLLPLNLQCSPRDKSSRRGAHQQPSSFHVSESLSSTSAPFSFTVVAAGDTYHRRKIPGPFELASAVGTRVI